MRDDQAGLLLQEKFMAKKRKRIELMQSREKQVVFADLTVNQLRDLVFKGIVSEVSEEERGKNLPNIRETLMNEAKSDIVVDEHGKPMMAKKLSESKENATFIATNNSAADKMRQ